MSLKILHRVDQEIFRLSEVKNFLRISHDYDDMMILELINSSIDAAENFLRFKLLATTIQISENHLVNSKIVPPLSPIVKIKSIVIKTKTEEARNIEQYILKESVLTIPNLPHYESITVDYIAGFTDQKAIPSAIEQGLLLHTAEMYDSHGVASSISDEVRKLYQPYRKMLV